MAEIDAKSIPGPQIEDACTIELPEVEVDSTQSTLIEEKARPSLHLLSDRKAYLEKCVPLQKAALKGDVEAAKRLLRMDARMLCAAISEGRETVLHIATGARQTAFVEEMVKLMEPEHLILQDENGNTAFCFAAAVGAVQIARIMLKKNPSLLMIRGGKSMTPLYMATLFERTEMVSFLYSISKKGMTEEDRKVIFFTSINTGLYDLALQLFEDDEELAVAHHAQYGTALHMLARNPSAFASRSPGLRFTDDIELMPTQALVLVKCLWKEIMQRHDIDLTELIRKPSKLLFDAAKLGNFVFLAELIRSYPDLVHELDEDERTIFHIAVLHRHSNTFNLIYEIGFNKELLASYVDKYGNNILHLAAKYSPASPVTSTSAAALEMQRELQTFKDVEKLVQPSFREMKNFDDKTPRELFTMEHKELMKSGEQWMKSTAKSCMLVATLIAIVMFVAAFSLIGGSDGNTGTPNPFRETSYLVFAVADVIAFSSSTISMLMFLSLLTLHFAESDFLKSLPFKLIIGLAGLFVSIITMIVAFCSISFSAYQYNGLNNWVLVFTTVFASMPISLVILLQFPLLKDIVCATYSRRIQLM